MQIKAIGAVFALALLAGCQSSATPASDPMPGDPDAAVAKLRDAWAMSRADRPHASTNLGSRKVASRVMLRRQAENVVFRHPNHVDARMLCALMAYDAEDSVESARHLDYLLRRQPSAPDAALLRARIAIEAGNPSLAERLLMLQARLRPDHAGLRETLASVRFFGGDLTSAHAELDAAEQLGADPARIAYNRGLLVEQSGDSGTAAAHYQRALDLSPGWSLARARMKGLDTVMPRPSRFGIAGGHPAIHAAAVEDTSNVPPPLAPPPVPPESMRPTRTVSELPLPGTPDGR